MTTAQTDRAWPLIASLTVGGVLLFWAGYTAIQSRGQAVVEEQVEVEAHTMAAVLAANGSLHPVHVRQPGSAPAVFVGENPETSKAVTASCTTCHSTRKPNPENGRTTPLTEFHTDLAFNHGAGAQSSLSCLSCHNASDYDALRLADGSALAFVDVMQACAQCHGRQYESYQHGAHGGMNGYWDLSRGPRTRNTCTDCHDPHSPAFPSMKPTFKPIDRGLEPEHGH